MTSRRITQSALAAISRQRKPLTATSQVSISSMVKLHCSSHPQSIYVHHQHSKEEDHCRAEVFRTAISHPLQDYVPTSDASNFLVTWPAHLDNGDTLTARMLNTLEGIRQSTSVQVTPPFYVLDGRGDKLASMCIVPSTNHSRDCYNSTSCDEWQAPGPWTEYHLSLNH